ncbi:hypothetical protein [Nocardia sp. NPDC052566]|uniref:WXG100-like domain-containing protein n=1 Tax=Nocardia sp. NPDC052566 TaxID=3364330 RepID=UPI0037CBD99A
MAIEIPGWLQWVAPLAGNEWPQGNEDLQRVLGRSLTELSDDLRGVLADADQGLATTQAGYRSGHGRDRMEQVLNNLRSGAGSLDDMVPAYRARGQQAEEFALAIRSTKLDILFTLGWAALELEWAAASGPGGWAASIEIIGKTQLRCRWLGMALEKVIARLLARLSIKSEMVVRAVVEMVEEALQEVAQGISQEAAIQKLNIDAGFQDRFDRKKLILNAQISALAGAAGGLGGFGLHTRLTGTQWEQPGFKGMLGGAAVGAGAGLIGAAGAVAATGALTNQWSADPLGFLSGAALGVGPSALRGYRGPGHGSAPDLAGADTAPAAAPSAPNPSIGAPNTVGGNITGGAPLSGTGTNSPGTNASGPSAPNGGGSPSAAPAPPRRTAAPATPARAATAAPGPPACPPRMHRPPARALLPLTRTHRSTVCPRRWRSRSRTRRRPSHHPHLPHRPRPSHRLRPSRHQQPPHHQRMPLQQRPAHSPHPSHRTRPSHRPRPIRLSHQQVPPRGPGMLSRPPACPRSGRAWRPAVRPWTVHRVPPIRMAA